LVDAKLELVLGDAAWKLYRPSEKPLTTITGSNPVLDRSHADNSIGKFNGS
jgi:hypothetical protein